MVILTEYSYQDEVWYWGKDGSFNKSRVIQIDVCVKPQYNFIGAIVNAFAIMFGFRQSDGKGLVDPQKLIESIVYTLADGSKLPQKKLFADPEEAKNSIKIFHI